VANVNGLLHRLERVELLLPRDDRGATIDAVDEHAQFWWPVFQVAPQPLWDYFCAVPDVQSHPAAKDAYEALWQRIEHPHRLAHVQGSVIQWAQWRLGWSLARDRQTAGVTTSVMYDAYVQEQAAQQLMGWTHRDSTEAWAYPERFAEQWRNVARTTFVPDMLEQAGLHAEELELLDQEED